jgi:uncharacterized protein YndB with AHSA1/START domain
MTRVEESIDIDAPIDDVFAAVTDPRRTPQWNAAIVEVSELSDARVGVGLTWRQVARYAGRTVTFQCRVDEYNPPHEGVLDITGDYEARIVTLCERVERRTRVIQSIEFAEPTGLRGRLEMKVVHPLIRHEMRGTMARQKEALEREAKAESGPPAD